MGYSSSIIVHLTTRTARTTPTLSSFSSSTTTTPLCQRGVVRRCFLYKRPEHRSSGGPTAVVVSHRGYVARRHGRRRCAVAAPSYPLPAAVAAVTMTVMSAPPRRRQRRGVVHASRFAVVVDAPPGRPLTLPRRAWSQAVCARPGGKGGGRGRAAAAGSQRPRGAQLPSLCPRRGWLAAATRRPSNKQHCAGGAGGR